MKIFNDFELSQVLYYRIGPKVKHFIQVENETDLDKAIDFINSVKPKKVLFVGLGSNILINDDYFDGAIISLHIEKESILKVNEDTVKVFAGVTLDRLILFGFENNLTGLEVLGGLPSTVGAAIRGNAGAFGLEIKNVVEKVEAIDLSDSNINTLEFSSEQCDFVYRDSIFKKSKNLLIIQGYFKLKFSNNEEIFRAREVYTSKIEYRNQRHPMEYPSCGSVFKNIHKSEDVEKILEIWPDIQDKVNSTWHRKVSMGYVINRLGFTGKKIGGAVVSEKHSNYISNIENASFKDVLTIIEEIGKEFKKVFGFSPELEVQVVS